MANMSATLRRPTLAGPIVLHVDGATGTINLQAPVNTVAEVCLHGLAAYQRCRQRLQAQVLVFVNNQAQQLDGRGCITNLQGGRSMQVEVSCISTDR